MRWVFLSLFVINVAIFVETQWFSAVISPELDASVGLLSGQEIPPLILLSELEINNAIVGTERLRSSQEEGGKSPLSRSLCTFVGSFASVEKANRLVDVLAAKGVAAKIKNLLVSSTVGFWLHLPPLVSRKEVLRRFSELQRQGVDSYIIPDGDLANGISLGMFSDKQRALLLKNNIEQLGYQPEIAEVPREKREVWVFLSQAESSKIGAEQWLELISGKELLQKQQNLCSDVASA